MNPFIKNVKLFIIFGICVQVLRSTFVTVVKRPLINSIKSYYASLSFPLQNLIKTMKKNMSEDIRSLEKVEDDIWQIIHKSFAVQ